MRLELNLPAIERLIGGDTEVEINLRRQIVDEFVKRHLKSIADDDLHKAAVESIKVYVNELVRKEWGVNIASDYLSSSSVKCRLKSIVCAMIENAAREKIEEVIQDKIERYKTYWTKEIKDKIMDCIDRQIEKEVEDRIRQRLEAAAKIKS